MKIHSFAAFLTSAVLVFPQQQDAARFFPRTDLMTIGVYYYPEQWPESDWARDFKNIAALGFEFVHMAEFSWAFLEPREGVFDFAWLAEKHPQIFLHNVHSLVRTKTKREAERVKGRAFGGRSRRRAWRCSGSLRRSSGAFPLKDGRP